MGLNNITYFLYYRVNNVVIYLGSRKVKRVVMFSDIICLHPEYTIGVRGKDIALIKLPAEIAYFNGVYTF